MHLSHWCVYFQLLYNTMDFYQWKLNLTWSCKWIIGKKITEHTCWSVGVQSTCHIKFCMCDDSMPKQILVCVGTRECDQTLFIDRPGYRGKQTWNRPADLQLFLERDSNTGVFLWSSWNPQEPWWLLLKTDNILM